MRFFNLESDPEPVPDYLRSKVHTVEVVDDGILVKGRVDVRKSVAITLKDENRGADRFHWVDPKPGDNFSVYPYPVSDNVPNQRYISFWRGYGPSKHATHVPTDAICIQPLLKVTLRNLFAKFPFPGR